MCTCCGLPFSKNSRSQKRKTTAGFLKLVVQVPGTYASQLRTNTCHSSVVHRAYIPNDLLLLFIKDLLVMGSIFGGQVKF
jgi:hypothetical protein